MAVADDIASIEKKITRLKADYEQYFMGFQKLPPEKLRSQVERVIQVYSNQRITNTALNFRYKAAVARYNSYRSHWDRVLREIEEGRYSRDIFKMKLHDRMLEEATVPARPAPLTEATQSEEELIKKIYHEYIEARKKTHEPSVRYDTVANLIKKQIPMIKERYHCASVDFRVIIEEGKAKLKAQPKR